MIATAAMEQRMIGHMKPPPARMISHIASSLSQKPEKTAGMILEHRELRQRYRQSLQVIDLTETRAIVFRTVKSCIMSRCNVG
jgi:hypothetical protein